MILRLSLLQLLTISAVLSCNTPRQGCYKHNNRVEHILFSDRQEHGDKDFHSGQDIKWSEMENYLKEATCRCETAAAAKNYKYFSFRNFGECHGIKSLSGLSPSIYCFHHSDAICEEHHEKCTGAEEGEFIYKVTKTSSQPIEMCGTMAGTYFHNTKLQIVNGKQIQGTIGNEPPFKGEIEHASTTECKGKVNFPNDRTYPFYYDLTTCTIHWDSKEGTNKWVNLNCEARDNKQDACRDMSADWTNVDLKVSAQRHISGKIENRTPFKGQVTIVTASECRGWVHFPDDRTYYFEYDRNTCFIHWGHKIWKNKWRKLHCRNCEGISGNYHRHTQLKINGEGAISGRIGSRPAFYGKITSTHAWYGHDQVAQSTCKGSVTFPDDRTYKFNYDKNTCRIQWDNGHYWTNPKCSQIDNSKDACSDMQYEKYAPNTPLRVNSHRQITGHIGNRPPYKGMVTLATSQECRGWVNFPDDRTYHFQYNRKTCVIDWGTSNKWTKPCHRG